MTSNERNLLEMLLQHPQGNVYSVMAQEVYKSFHLDKSALTNAIHGLIKQGYDITTFSTKRDLWRIQINQNDIQIQNYKELTTND